MELQVSRDPTKHLEAATNPGQQRLHPQHPPHRNFYQCADEAIQSDYLPESTKGDGNTYSKWRTAAEHGDGEEGWLQQTSSAAFQRDSEVCSFINLTRKNCLGSRYSLKNFSIFNFRDSAAAMLDLPDYTASSPGPGEKVFHTSTSHMVHRYSIICQFYPSTEFRAQRVPKHKDQESLCIALIF